MEYAPWSDQTPIETNSPQFTCNSASKKKMTKLDNGYQWRFQLVEKPHFGGYDKCLQLKFPMINFDLQVALSSAKMQVMNMIYHSPCSGHSRTGLACFDDASTSLLHLLSKEVIQAASCSFFKCGQDLVPIPTHESWTIVLKPKGWTSWVKKTEKKHTYIRYWLPKAYKARITEGFT